MPGRPVTKANNVDALLKQFADFARRFDELLPPAYRFDGSAPGRDHRANAWAKCDQHVVILADALTRLQAILRQHAKMSANDDCATDKE